MLLYRWLITHGIRPRKSLTLAGVDVPPEHLVSFIRGLLDGDGSIYTKRHRPTPRTYPNYWYERLWTFFTSASRAHIDWLREEIHRELGLDGYVETRQQEGRHDFYRLKYGNRASMVLLSVLYADRGAPCLLRKRRKFDLYVRRNGAEGGI
ncbi:MAG: hypothetical protein Q7S41_02575 [Candidatus Limnocylindria bacterium]|nr:hypothetical protein [Candidatus Limnocylindria bacterium]